MLITFASCNIIPNISPKSDVSSCVLVVYFENHTSGRGAPKVLMDQFGILMKIKPVLVFLLTRFSSGQLGLILQGSGYLTSERIQSATIFVDIFPASATFTSCTDSTATPL